MMRERLSKVILLIFVFALSPWYFTCCPAWTEPSVDCLAGDEGCWCCQNDIGVLEVHAHGEQCSILLFCRLKMRLHDCFFRSDVWSSCLITTSSTIYEHNNLGSNKHRFDYFCGSCCSNMECSFLFAKTIAKEGNESGAGAFVVDAGMAEGRIFIWSAGRVARSKKKKTICYFLTGQIYYYH